MSQNLPDMSQSVPMIELYGRPIVQSHSGDERVMRVGDSLSLHLVQLPYEHLAVQHMRYLTVNHTLAPSIQHRSSSSSSELLLDPIPEETRYGIHS
jgi:hypothetical protein